jgi:hypothetical protein
MCERRNDKSAGAMHELNAVKECREVEQETRWCSIGQWCKPVKNREGEVVGGLVCKHRRLVQCGGIQCLKGPTRPSQRLFAHYEML